MKIDLEWREECSVLFFVGDAPGCVAGVENQTRSRGKPFILKLAIIMCTCAQMCVHVHVRIPVQCHVHV